jgi:hypothetical protein
MANRPNISKGKKEENTRMDGCGIISGQMCHAKESREETCQELMY